ncbi:hypothetical protein [Quatrionicoccus australiensis]|uniref:hypothetical protein n=1 Tax=Quatrionicoccus australiensis TaxID=138118 RepID=UPI001CFA0A06|nr:hypothetical protein [Quatrionicoccus australiensis]MCB4358562.1 hypothetical protein [Quatrionicoccus australiensis]
MNKKSRVFPLALALLLGACAYGYQARGSLSDVAGELRGKGYPGNSGGGRFVLSERHSGLTCDGIAEPAKSSPNPGSCLGESGEGLVRCSDGREIRFTWRAITCRSLQGSGVDARGNRLEFVVDRP